MIFTLAGFSHRRNVRVFRFQRVDSARVRTLFTVDVDLGSLARFKISVQEAPLMCVRLLEAQSEADANCTLELTADDMKAFVDQRSAAMSERTKKRRMIRRPQPGSPLAVPSPL
jgi:hypothetical protein